MDVRDRVVVVTGGASGIGRALCHSFARHGARAVVVADLDGPGAAAVVDEIERGGGRAAAILTDVSVERDVVELVRRTEAEYGPIDLFCANAGIVVPGGVDTSNEAWERIWAVNVMSHVYATRAVLPGMLERGEGYLLHTASAAGLLTQLDSASYAVTKHAVVALAEWLAITYGDEGIGVSCLCPQGVRTNMFGGDVESTSAPLVGRDGVLEPDAVAESVVAGLAVGRFLILPHPEVAIYERRRADDRGRWLQGMRRVRAVLTTKVQTPEGPPG